MNTPALAKNDLVSRTELRLKPDPRRVITKLFVPGDDAPAYGSRAASVVDRVMAMDEAEVQRVLAATTGRFAPRHPRLTETFGGHFSPAPAGGWQPGEPRPGFDQQPIEVAALADACATAFAVTGDPRWAHEVAVAAAWFEGDNDTRIPMRDPATGGGYDGLEPTGHNENQGAESTLALLSTLQQHRRLRVRTL